MKHQESQPTQDQLLAMAYADGELERDSRRQFEQRLKSEPKLVREVAQLKKLEVLTRQVATPEPMDYEWERLDKDSVQNMGWNVGWGLLFLGSVGGMGWLGFALFDSEIELVPKLLMSALFVGSLVLFLITLRGRLRTLHYDPYTEVKR